MKTELKTEMKTELKTELKNNANLDEELANKAMTQQQKHQISKKEVLQSLPATSSHQGYSNDVFEEDSKSSI